MNSNYNLSDKKALYWNLRSYCEANDVDLDQIIPKTFHVMSKTEKEYKHFL